MNINKLKGAIPDSVLAEIPSVVEKFGINSNLRLAHFLGQCAHESGTFTVVRENLNYSGERLVQIFPKYFPTIESTKGYAKNPERIANKVYGSRMGNGNEASGDGYKFSGRGYIQLTGKQNYTLFDDFVPELIIAEPALVATKYPLLSAAWFWSRNSLNALADQGNGVEVVTKITRKVNGGTHGLDDRIRKFNNFYSLLTK